MTLWNPLNVFTSPQRQPGDDPLSAAFDPARTGDPLGGNQSPPAIGFGDTRVGPGASRDPRRQPIGFAPPQEEGRFRTELSFKRHHESPRASAVRDHEDEDSTTAWQTPVPAFPVDETAAEVHLVDAHEVEDATENDSEQADVDGVDQIDEKRVPFYKRELGFRRKRLAADVADEAPEVQDSDETLEESDEAAPIEAEARSEEEHEVSDDLPHETDYESADDVVAVSSEDDDEILSEDVDDEILSEDVTVPTASAAAGAKAASVPFYKRELSFRRKSAQPEEESVTPFPDEIESDQELVQDENIDAFNDSELSVEPLPAAAAPDTLEDTATPADRSGEDGDAEDGDATVAAGDDDVAEWDISANESAQDQLVPVAAIAASITADAPEPEKHDQDDASLDTAADFTGAQDVDGFPEVEDAADVEGALEVEDAADVDGALEVEDAADVDGALEVEDAADVGGAEDVDRDASDGTPPPTDGATKRWKKRTSVRPAKRQSGRGSKGNKVVGLKIGASQIAAAVVTEADGGHQLVQLARRPLEPGIVVDGEVRDQDALANALKAFFDDEQLPKKGVRIGLASNRIGVRTFDIVGIDDEERFDNAVRFKAHEVLPVAVHEAVLDYRVLEQRPNEAGEQMRRVLLVVAPKDQVAPYQSVADRVGLNLIGIDLEALGLLRAFVDPKPFAARLADDTATVVVAIGHESSTLLVAGGGACEFTRVFDWGGGALQGAIGESLEVMPAEAATILRHLSLSGPGRKYDGLDDATRMRATEAVRLGLTPFARELVNSLQFYQTQTDSLGIGEIVITGGTSQLEGLDEALHAMIGVKATVGNPLGRVSVDGQIDPAIEAAIGSMAVSIGLAINDDRARAVNLLREASAKPKNRRASLVAVGVPVAAAVPLVALGLLYFGAHGKASDQQAQLDAVRAEIAALPQPPTPTIGSGVIGDEAVRASSVASVLGGRLAWDAVLRDLSRVLPENVWLTKLSVTQPAAGNLADGAVPVAAVAPGVAPTPTAVSIDGFTYSQPDVARLLARLGTLATLKNVTLTSSQIQPLGNRDVAHFVIVADLNQTGGPS